MPAQEMNPIPAPVTSPGHKTEPATKILSFSPIFAILGRPSTSSGGSSQQLPLVHKKKYEG
jgi:hypothetical protein